MQQYTSYKPQNQYQLQQTIVQTQQNINHIPQYNYTNQPHQYQKSPQNTIISGGQQLNSVNKTPQNLIKSHGHSSQSTNRNIKSSNQQSISQQTQPYGFSTSVNNSTVKPSYITSQPPLSVNKTQYQQTSITNNSGVRQFGSINSKAQSVKVDLKSSQKDEQRNSEHKISSFLNNNGSNNDIGNKNLNSIEIKDIKIKKQDKQNSQRLEQIEQNPNSKIISKEVYEKKFEEKDIVKTKIIKQEYSPFQNQSSQNQVNNQNQYDNHNSSQQSHSTIRSSTAYDMMKKLDLNEQKNQTKRKSNCHISNDNGYKMQNQTQTQTQNQIQNVNKNQEYIKKENEYSNHVTNTVIRLSSPQKSEQISSNQYQYSETKKIDNQQSSSSYRIAQKSPQKIIIKAEIQNQQNSPSKNERISPSKNESSPSKNENFEKQRQKELEQKYLQQQQQKNVQKIQRTQSDLELNKIEVLRQQIKDEKKSVSPSKKIQIQKNEDGLQTKITTTTTTIKPTNMKPQFLDNNYYKPSTEFKQESIKENKQEEQKQKGLKEIKQQTIYKDQPFQLSSLQQYSREVESLTVTPKDDKQIIIPVEEQKQENIEIKKHQNKLKRSVSAEKISNQYQNNTYVISETIREVKPEQIEAKYIKQNNEQNSSYNDNNKINNVKYVIKQNNESNNVLYTQQSKNNDRVFSPTPVIKKLDDQNSYNQSINNNKRSQSFTDNYNYNVLRQKGEVKYIKKDGNTYQRVESYDQQKKQEQNKNQQIQSSGSTSIKVKIDLNEENKTTNIPQLSKYANQSGSNTVTHAQTTNNVQSNYKQQEVYKMVSNRSSGSHQIQTSKENPYNNKIYDITSKYAEYTPSTQLAKDRQQNKQDQMNFTTMSKQSQQQQNIKEGYVKVDQPYHKIISETPNNINSNTNNNLNKNQKIYTPQHSIQQSNGIVTIQDRMKQSIDNKKKQWSLENFVILKSLGQGIFGKAYLALDKETKFLSALKVMEKKKIMDMNLVDQTLKEIKIHTILDHPNIVKCYGFFDTQSQIILGMEYCKGGNLFELMYKQKNRRFDETKAANFMSQVISAVQYLHSLGVIHRDIKPENILVIDDTVKLSDFGIASFNDGTRQTFCGTLEYVSPEIIHRNVYDTNVDVWALGVLAYEICNGDPPFMGQGNDQKAFISQVNFRMPQHFSRDLQDFVGRILIKDPKRRMDLNQALNHKWIVNNCQKYEKEISQGTNFQIIKDTVNLIKK